MASSDSLRGPSKEMNGKQTGPQREKNGEKTNPQKSGDSLLTQTKRTMIETKPSPDPAKTRLVTVEMLAKHADKHPATVLRALDRAKIAKHKLEGAKGYRVTERDARAFLNRQWPQLPALQLS
jgi:hypothetical protein